MNVDFSDVLASAVYEHGFSKEEITGSEKTLKKVKKAIIEKKNTLYFPLNLPTTMQKETKEIIEYANSIRDSFDNLVVVGMGGSILGNELLHFALKGTYANLENEKKVYFIDNIDPETNLTLLENLDLRRTFFNIITKSGSTSETLLNMLLIRELTKKKNINFEKQVLFTTDPNKGFLRKLSQEFNIKTYPIHPDVGGRYSVLSHVGLFSAAFENIDIEKLLEGARKREKHFIKNDVLNESSLILPLLQYKFFKEHKVNINVLFSYSDGLEYMGKWYEQLLAESIGKKFSISNEVVSSGITPVVARGPYHQHSTLQLFMEGPYDKLIIFLVPNSFRKDYQLHEEFKDEEAVAFLQNNAYSKLLLSEYRATKMALTEYKRPNISIEIEEINEEEVGNLIYFFELSVIALGELFNVNPIDQPSVEVGKRITHALMGDKNYSDVLKDIEKTDKSDKLILS